MTLQTGVILGFVLVSNHFCWGLEGQVTCRDENNGPVDWYILYKNPQIGQLTGEEYMYLDSKEQRKGSKSIKDPHGALANTLQPIFMSVRDMKRTFGFISYSDQPPGCNADSKEFGHSKGLLMVDKMGSGVWLLHSTPQFPFKRNQDHFWPNTAMKNAQIFICVTFPYTEFQKIGLHLQYIGAFPYEHDIPSDFHPALIEATDWKKTQPPNNFEILTSSGGQTFKGFAKQQSEEAEDGDLYKRIADLVGSDMYAQTWHCEKDSDDSYCQGHNVFNVLNIKTSITTWGGNDHSKWCVAKTKDSVCIADVNRATSQYKRRGGALCLEHKDTNRRFQDFVLNYQNCPKKRRISCDPDYIG